MAQNTTKPGTLAVYFCEDCTNSAECEALKRCKAGGWSLDENVKNKTTCSAVPRNV